MLHVYHNLIVKRVPPQEPDFFYFRFPRKFIRNYKGTRQSLPFSEFLWEFEYWNCTWVNITLDLSIMCHIFEKEKYGTYVTCLVTTQPILNLCRSGDLFQFFVEYCFYFIIDHNWECWAITLHWNRSPFPAGYPFIFVPITCFFIFIFSFGLDDS